MDIPEKLSYKIWMQSPPEEDPNRISTRSSHKDLHEIMHGHLKYFSRTSSRSQKELYKIMLKLFWQHVTRISARYSDKDGKKVMCRTCKSKSPTTSTSTRDEAQCKAQSTPPAGWWTLNNQTKTISGKHPSMPKPWEWKVFYRSVLVQPVHHREKSIHSTSKTGTWLKWKSAAKEHKGMADFLQHWAGVCWPVPQSLLVQVDNVSILLQPICKTHNMRQKQYAEILGGIKIWYASEAPSKGHLQKAAEVEPFRDVHSRTRDKNGSCQWSGENWIPQSNNQAWILIKRCSQWRSLQSPSKNNEE